MKHLTHNKVVLIKHPENKVKHVNFEMFQKKKWKFAEEEAEIDVDTEELFEEFSEEEESFEESSEESPSEDFSEESPEELLEGDSD